MEQNRLENATTLELLIELMYEGKSGIVPELGPLEPIPVEALAELLGSRHNQRLGTSFEAWNNWFQGPGSPASKEDRETLERLKDFKDRTDPLFKRARERLE